MPPQLHFRSRSNISPESCFSTLECPSQFLLKKDERALVLTKVDDYPITSFYSAGPDV